MATGSTRTLVVSAQHPAFDGHFPGAPLLPGVVLLDEVLYVVTAALGGHGWTISSAKFLHPVRPGESLTVEHDPPVDSPGSGRAIRFFIRTSGDGRTVASGTLIPRATEGPDHGHQAG